MKPTKFTVSGGEVERCDADNNGTTRLTWRAWINLEFVDTIRRRRDTLVMRKTAAGTGDGKAPHVALKRAIDDALAKARR